MAGARRKAALDELLPPKAPASHLEVDLCAVVFEDRFNIFRPIIYEGVNYLTVPGEEGHFFVWSSDAPRRPRRRLVNVKGPSKFRTASSAVDRPRLRYRCDAAAFHAWTPGRSLMMVCSTECSTSARVCCRSCAARRPRSRSQTRQRRGAAPETALSSAVSSQAQRHQVWCKTPRATGSPSPTPPTLKTIGADVRDEAKSRAGPPSSGAIT